MLQTSWLSPGYKPKNRSNNQVHKTPSNKPSANTNAVEINKYHLDQVPCWTTRHSLNAATHIAGTCASYKTKNELIIDSGASIHICFQKHIFSDLKPIASSIVLPNNSQIPLHYIGSVILFDFIVVHRVLFVPEFQYNLLSVSGLMKDMHSL